MGFGNGLHHGTANMAIGHHVVVQRTMGFNIGNGRINVICHASQCSDLILHDGDDFYGG